MEPNPVVQYRESETIKNKIRTLIKLASGLSFSSKNCFSLLESVK